MCIKITCPTISKFLGLNLANVHLYTGEIFFFFWRGRVDRARSPGRVRDKMAAVDSLVKFFYFQSWL